MDLNPNPPADSDRESVARYLENLGVQRRLAPLTLAAYRGDLEALLATAADCGLNGLDAGRLRRALAERHGRGLSGRSLARMLSAWRGFFRWRLRQGLASADPSLGLRAPRTPRRLPAVLSPEQASRLLGGAPEGALGLRDQALFELAYSSGLRVSELVGLDVGAALDLAGGELRVFGKRSKARVVPVGRQAVGALSAWLVVRGELAREDEPALFVSRFGRRLSARALQYRLAALAAARGLSQPVHPHMLRHSSASHLLQSSSDLRAVQEFLGHASIATTQVYTHLDFQHMARVYDSAHPRAHIKKPPGSGTT
ncbi:MAG: tyrosine recombinase XerC [Betaproteobacteria bacterium]